MDKPKLLIIDDDEELCLELAEILRQENYIADTVFDGRSGISRIGGRGYSLVILDLKMPRMSGYDVLRYIRAGFPSLKVIVITGIDLNKLNAEMENVFTKKAGESPANILKRADAVLSKPFDVEELLNKISELTSKCRPV
ncbi:MAG: hypothetical protein COV72_03830 [Candidatus Omnitrophica bacterium CG11_big_fil_rev_8_21_14_0_20_42_13]|uniref:Response regulatory domain-containing protein n=1 Tax=Candidatus Ghiorseimicrobium undicola TaxID=1974746 RepID=A0A2H0LY12_9BACT|nr:MAG: hypothetical protein COV72_03830 [Candidatus Omnitrophica bacterium CG11_big_fil_rev_8_21_14_0_20_42_13]